MATLANDKMIMFGNRLSKVFRHLSRQARRLGVSCYRVYDHDLPEFPFCIELYEEKLYVAEYKRRHGMNEEEHDRWMEESLGVVADVLKIPSANIFLKLRQRKPGRLGQYQKLDEAQHEFTVSENGLKFIVNLSDYLDTGLFLDHRLTRQIVRDECMGKKVLNLFSYTGSFSVYAAAGKATEVVSVDLSHTYLKWAQRNMRLNDFADNDRYQFIHADVKEYLKNMPADHFDIVVIDPPTFSNSKRMDDYFDIQRDHVELINDCIRGMKRGGVIYFSTNFQKFRINEKEIRVSATRDITAATTSFDFEGRAKRYCFRLTI
jgi:23S rRNA (cytosine1962-C5)-methyltransferase